MTQQLACLCKAISSEFHYSKLCFCHENKKAFFFSPWFPQKWGWPQVWYLVYRWLLMIYFLVWLFITISHAALGSIGFKYFIFLTHWGFMAWNGYLFISAITIAAAALTAACNSRGGASSSIHSEMMKHTCPSPKKFDLSVSSPPPPNNGINDSHRAQPQSRSTSGLLVEHSQKQQHQQQQQHAVLLCCGRSGGAGLNSRVAVLLELALKLQWALFLIGGEYALVITVLYWGFFTDSASSSKHNLFSLDSLHLHMINGILAVVELWLSGIPVRLCHAAYSIAFGCAYVLFTGLYYLAGGCGAEGNKFIYPFLDYDSNAKGALSLAAACAIFLVGGIHVVFFVQYQGRRYITDKIQSRYFAKPCCEVLSVPLDPEGLAHHQLS